MTALQVHRLGVRTRVHPHRDLLTDIGLVLPAGGRLGVVGASGAGKSLLARALTGFCDPAQLTVTGQLQLTADTGAIDLAGDRVPDRVTPTVVALWQDSLRALNPCQTVGTQLRATLRLHHRLTRRAATGTALDWLDRVALPDPREVAGRHPHQLSGGMRQRVALALALCGTQPVVLADEPTTALDTIAQQQVTTLLDRLCTEDGRSLLFISHDLPLVAALCPRLLVLDHGRVVETGPTSRLLTRPGAPATRALVEAATRLRTRAGART